MGPEQQAVHLFADQNQSLNRYKTCTVHRALFSQHSLPLCRSLKRVLSPMSSLAKLGQLLPGTSPLPIGAHTQDWTETGNSSRKQPQPAAATSNPGFELTLHNSNLSIQALAHHQPGASARPLPESSRPHEGHLNWVDNGRQSAAAAGKQPSP